MLMFGIIELSESSTLSFHCSVMKMIVNNLDDSFSVNHGINIYMCGSIYYMIHERVNMRNNESNTVRNIMGDVTCEVD